MDAALPRIIEWFRPDRKRQIGRVFLIACAVLATGALLVGLANTGMLNLGESGRNAVAIFGAVTTLSGPLIAVIGLPMVIGGDDYLALSLEGVVLAQKNAHRTIRWEELQRAYADRDALCLAIDNGDVVTVVEHFSGIELSDLAARINRTQQRALMGLIPTR